MGDFGVALKAPKEYKCLLIFLVVGRRCYVFVYNDWRTGR